MADTAPRKSRTTDPDELVKFDRLADSWWDPDGPLRTLHAINPVRLAFINSRIELKGKRVLDIGCGGGLLSEAMAGSGAQVIGIDASDSSISVARAHLEDGPVDYRVGTAEELLEEHRHGFDAITCMELLEHVPAPDALLQTAAELLRPEGSLFVSTINRNPLAWLTGIVAAEYLLGLLPRGTHEYARFIRPSELCAWLREGGFEVADIHGIQYLPFLNRAALSANTSVNYLVHARYRP